MTRQEFAKLIEEEGHAVYSFCNHLAGNKDETDELYQETMLKAMERCSTIDCHGNPKSLLLGIAVGNWRNAKKKYARRQRIAPQDSIDDKRSFPELRGTGMSPEEAYLSKEMCRLVKMETAALDDKYRIPIYMYYTAELSVEEISKVLHIPKGTVKSRLHKARTIIGKNLEDYGYE